MPTQQQELKSCPFDGGKGRICATSRGLSKTLYWVKCANTKCDSQGPMNSVEMLAIAAWNHRAPHPAAEGLATALEEAQRLLSLCEFSEVLDFAGLEFISEAMAVYKESMK